MKIDPEQLKQIEMVAAQDRISPKEALYNMLNTMLSLQHLPDSDKEVAHGLFLKAAYHKRFSSEKLDS